MRIISGTARGKKLITPSDRSIRPALEHRTPEQAANTNPELIAELARLCLAAGAASVIVARAAAASGGGLAGNKTRLSNS